MNLVSCDTLLVVPAGSVIYLFRNDWGLDVLGRRGDNMGWHLEVDDYCYYIGTLFYQECKKLRSYAIRKTKSDVVVKNFGSMSICVSNSRVTYNVNSTFTAKVYLGHVWTTNNLVRFVEEGSAKVMEPVL